MIHFYSGYECDMHNNPADFFLDVLGGYSETSTETENKNKTGKRTSFFLLFVISYPSKEVALSAKCFVYSPEFGSVLDENIYK